MALRGWRRLKAGVTIDVRFERYDATARRAIALANQNATAAGHATITSVHLACALASPPIGEGLGLDVAPDDLQRALAPMPTPPAAPAGLVQPPLDPEMKRLLVEAFVEADQGGSEEVGAEHLLLALLARPERGGGRVLVEVGVDPEAVRDRWGRPGPGRGS